MNFKFLRKVFTFSIILLFSSYVFSQSNNTVDISDNVYELLKTAEVQGLCSTLSNVRPYTEKYIDTKLCEILDNLDKLEEDEISDNSLTDFFKPKHAGLQKEVVQAYRDRFVRPDGLSLKTMSFKVSDKRGALPVTFAFDLSTNAFVSSGFYSDSDNNSTGFEIWEDIHFFGDIGNHISYRSLAYLEATKMDLQKLGEYDIGWWWYDIYGNPDNFNRQEHFSDRTINTYRNYAVLPYSYKKNWDGSVYYLKGGVNSSGLTGWPFEPSLAFGMQGELHGTFFDDFLDVGIGRLNREWAAMDKGSSLVLNADARPFFGVEASVKLFDWLTFSTISGSLEFPNQNYINGKDWYSTDGYGNQIKDWYSDGTFEEKEIKDSFYFHNLFAMSMLDLDLKYLHFDFGSSVVFPNRFELGYSFPLVDHVVYQNNVGDYDNLSLYSNVKFRYPGIGYVWGSIYIDEINAFMTDIFHNTRCMFAYQGGTKVNIPWLPFASLSFRYTKVEPYCYTHEALDSVSEQPYYSHYISESYTNNGSSLGYYLPPNADEFLVKINTQPLPASSFGFSYQLIRHGVDWGSESNIYSGSSIYSELPAGPYGPGRNNLHKYFLRDGVYEWMNILALEASYDFKKDGIPLQVYASIGYVHNWFTSIGNAEASKSTKYSKYSSEEYKENRGFVISLGIKAFAF